MSPNPSVEEKYLIPGTSIVVYTKDYLKKYVFLLK